MGQLNYKKVRDNVPTPEYKTEGSAGFDLHAMIDYSFTLYSGASILIPTGIAIELPDNSFEGQVRPRSGLACKFGVTVVNSPGTVDSDYRGEIKVGLINLSNTAYEIQPLDRVAQLVICHIYPCILQEVKELSSTERGGNGFGSTD